MVFQIFQCLTIQLKCNKYKVGSLFHFDNALVLTNLDNQKKSHYFNWFPMLSLILLTIRWLELGYILLLITHCKVTAISKKYSCVTSKISNQQCFMVSWEQCEKMCLEITENWVFSKDGNIIMGDKERLKSILCVFLLIASYCVYPIKVIITLKKEKDQKGSNLLNSISALYFSSHHSLHLARCIFFC